MWSAPSSKRKGPGASVRDAIAFGALAGCLALSACANRPGGELLGGAFRSTRGGAAFVDMSKVIAVHPLHGEVEALENQITALNSQTLVAPLAQTPQAREAADRLQQELANAQAAFEQEIERKRAFYEQREAEAVRALQEQALGGAGSGPAGALGGMQQQFGTQLKELQTQAGKTLTEYRQALVKEDTQALKHVQELVSREVSAKIRAKQSQLGSAETAYQIELAKQDQPAKLNLRAKLDNLTLSDAERAQVQADLDAIDRREQSLVNQMKARDDAELKAFTAKQQKLAAGRFDAERAAVQKTAQSKFEARQAQLQTEFHQQIGGLSGEFQQQVVAANRALANDPKLRAQVQRIHGEVKSKYVADASQAMSAYQQTRKMLVAKYSAIAHYQFVDNQEIAAQVDRLASQRRDLLAKIVDQIRAQVSTVARDRGIAVVFASVRGAGTAVDITDAVLAAESKLSPAAPPTSGG